MNESSATPLNNSYSNVSEAEKAVLGAIIERGSPAELLAPGAGTRTQDFCSRLTDLCEESC